MNQNISNHLQDADVLNVAAEKHQATLTTFGASPEFVESGRTLANSLRAKATAYDSSVNDGKDKTTIQNARMLESMTQIDTVKKYAKVAFYGDKVMKKEFHINVKLEKKVSVVTTELSYIKELGDQHKTELIAAGLKESDLTVLDDSLANLRSADAVQESAIKAQTVICAERDKLFDDLLAFKFKVRQIAAIAFRGNKAVLAEFKSIVPTSAKKKTDTTTETTTGA